MNLKNHLIALTLLVILAFLSYSNPTEKTYLSRVSHDYQQYHINYHIPTDILQTVGLSNRSTYLLFSTYNYQFGDTKIFYFGVASNIYYVGLKRKKKEKNPIKIV